MSKQVCIGGWRERRGRGTGEKRREKRKKRKEGEKGLFNDDVIAGSSCGGNDRDMLFKRETRETRVIPPANGREKLSFCVPLLFLFLFTSSRLLHARGSASRRTSTLITSCGIYGLVGKHTIHSQWATRAVHHFHKANGELLTTRRIIDNGTSCLNIVMCIGVYA